MAIRVGGQPLIPDVDQLTQLLASDAAGSSVAQPFERLKAQLTAGANLEVLLTHLRGLHAVAGEDDTIRGFSLEELNALEKFICDFVLTRTGVHLPRSGTPYHRVAAWAGHATRMQPVQLFTPNYDVLLEEALEALRVPYFDGFIGSERPFFDLRSIEIDELPPRWLRLWKLHGSVSWSIDEQGAVTRTAPIEGSAPVIYPSHLKYDQSRRMPYLAMFDRLRAFLRQPGAVIVTCGYSFRDQHLNEACAEGCASNPSAAVFGLLFGSMDAYTEGAAIAHLRPNLSLLAVDRAIVGTTESAWDALPEKPMETDELAVRWDESGDVLQSSFSLGDFARFGDFLGDVSGQIESVDEPGG